MRTKLDECRKRGIIAEIWGEKNGEFAEPTICIRKAYKTNVSQPEGYTFNLRDLSAVRIVAAMAEIRLLSHKSGKKP